MGWVEKETIFILMKRSELRKYYWCELKMVVLRRARKKWKNV